MGKIVRLIQSLHEQNMSSTFINKIYNMIYRKQELNEDTIDLTNSNIVGEITLITPVYKEYVEYIRKTFENLTVHATDYYVKFVDPNAEELCARLYGDSVGVTENSLAAITSMNASNWASSCQIVDFPEFKYFTGITSIDYQFSNSTDNINKTLKSIELPSSIINIGPVNGYGSGFFGTSIESIVINNGARLTSACFRDCSNLKHVTMGYGCRLDSQAFNRCTSLENIDLNGATRIEDAVFQNCTSLTSLTIPNTVSYIGNSFIASTGITSITFEEGNNNNSLVLEGSTSGWRPGVFRLTNANLKYVILPERLTELKDYALGNTAKLNFVFTSTTPPSVTGNGELGYVDESWIYVPDESIEAYKTAPGFSNYISRIKPVSEFNN